MRVSAIDVHNAEGRDYVELDGENVGVIRADELLELRRQVRAGTHELRIEPGRFSLREYRAFLASIAGDAAAFKARQQAAFDEERQRWRESGELEAARRHAGIVAAEAPAAEVEAGEGFEVVSAPLGAQVWRGDGTEGLLSQPAKVLAEKLILPQLGQVRVVFSRTSLDERRRTLLLLGALIGAIGLMFGVLLAAALSRGVIRPIMRVTRLIERIGHGEFTQVGEALSLIHI